MSRLCPIGQIAFFLLVATWGGPSARGAACGGNIDEGIFVFSGGQLLKAAGGVMVRRLGDAPTAVPAAGGGVLQSPGAPSLADDGRLAFTAGVVGGTVDQGVFLQSSGQLRLVAGGVARRRPGDTPTMALDGGGAVFRAFSDPALNARGDVAFSAQLLGGSVDEGVFLFVDGRLRKIAGGAGADRSDGTPSPAPGTRGTFHHFSAPGLNDAGDVVFTATIDGGTIDSGLFLFSQGQLALLAGGVSARRAGDTPTLAPDFGSRPPATRGVLGTLLPPSGSSSGALFAPAPAINDEGVAAFAATLHDARVDTGLFTVRRGLLTPVAGAVQARRAGDAPTPAPGSGEAVFRELGRPRLNGSGDVAFVATLLGAPERTRLDQGIFLSSGGRLALVAGSTLRRRPGDAPTTAPDTGGVFRRLGEPDLSDDGAVAFSAEIQEGVSGPPQADSGVFLAAGGLLTRIAVGVIARRPGSAPAPAPGTDGGRFEGFGDPSLNRSAEVAFAATVSGGPITTGIYTLAGSRAAAAQRLRKIAGGVEVPRFDARGAIVGLQPLAPCDSPSIAPDTGGGTFLSFVDPALNGRGEVAFRARVRDGEISEGIFFFSGGQLLQLAGGGRDRSMRRTRVPGTRDRVFTAFGPPRLNDQGDVVFQASTAGPTGPEREVLILATAGELRLIADSTPSGDANTRAPETGGAFFDAFDDPALNNQGEVVFHAAIAGRGGLTATVDAGTFVFGGGSFRKVDGEVRSSGVIPPGRSPTPAPGAGGVFRLPQHPVRPAINDRGDVAFVAGVLGGNVDEGVFLEQQGLLTKAAAGLARSRAGGAPTAAPGGAGVMAAFSGDPSRDREALPFQAVALDDAGDVLFNAGLTGGNADYGLFRFADGAISIIATAVRRRRRGDAPTPAPSTGGGFLVGAGLLGSLNDGREIAFRGDVAGGSVDSGLFGVAGGTLFLRLGAAGARPDALLVAAPGSGGGFISSVGTPSINAAGDLAFVAGLRPSSP